MDNNQETITSPANKRVRNVMALLEKSRERKKQKLFAAEGIKMFLEAPDRGIRQVYLSWDLVEHQEGFQQVSCKLQRLKEQGNVSIDAVKADVFKKMCDTKTPQGILCLVKMPEYDFKQMTDSPKGFYLVLENIQDPGNLGTMFRTGEGAGVQGIIMSSHTADVFNPKTIRATMGSIYRVPFVYTEDLEAGILSMKEKGVRIYAAHLQGEKSYDTEEYHGASAFLIGNEGNGLSGRITDLADTLLRIPMMGQVESLNAAVAAALLMYEAARQERK